MENMERYRRISRIGWCSDSCRVVISSQGSSGWAEWRVYSSGCLRLENRFSKQQQAYIRISGRFSTCAFLNRLSMILVSPSTAPQHSEAATLDTAHNTLICTPTRTCSTKRPSKPITANFSTRTPTMPSSALISSATISRPSMTISMEPYFIRVRSRGKLGRLGIWGWYWGKGHSFVTMRKMRIKWYYGGGVVVGEELEVVVKLKGKSRLIRKSGVALIFSTDLGRSYRDLQMRSSQQRWSQGQVILMSRRTGNISYSSLINSSCFYFLSFSFFFFSFYVFQFLPNIQFYPPKRSIISSITSTQMANSLITSTLPSLSSFNAQEISFCVHLPNRLISLNISNLIAQSAWY